MFINNSATYYRIKKKTEAQHSLKYQKKKTLLQQNIIEESSVLISAGRVDMMTEIYRGFIKYLQ
jgi:hypothetical protein